MHPLKPADIPNFLARFQTFYDAVLGEFSCQPPRKDRNQTSCAITFEAKDLKAESGWSLVTIRLEDVTSWKFAEPLNCAYYVMSGGVHIIHHNDLFYMEIGNLWDESNDINDYLASDFHFVARSIWWEAKQIV